MADQAAYFNSLAPNIQVKMPISEAGIKAFEDATYRGVSVNATVSFSLAQALALAEAVERVRDRRAAIRSRNFRSYHRSLRLLRNNPSAKAKEFSEALEALRSLNDRK